MWSRTGTRSCRTSWATIRVPLDRRLEIDVHLIGETGDPRQDVAEFVHLLIDRTLAYGLGELTEFLGEPGDRGGNTTSTVAVTVGLFDDAL